MNRRHKIKDRALLRASDKFELPKESTRVLTPEGYLKATAAVTRVGVQYYAAWEFGVEGSDAMIGVLRPPETVFHSETISSLRLKPITHLHPEEDVTAKNHNRLSIGTVGEVVEPIGFDILGAGIQITDADIVERVQKREIEELSLGYDCYIVSDEGEYMGQKYLYRFDGPMIINHLALVPEGRCGDTVKILDKGARTVTKKKAVKALRDAGVSEDKIKTFMADAKDDDPVDLAEYGKLITGKDVDMTALVPAIVAELKPRLEEIVKGPEFTGLLAKEIAASMAGAGVETPEMPDADAEDPDPNEDPEMPMDAAQMDAKVKDAANERARLITRASVFISDDKFDVHAETNEAIVKKALTAVGVSDKQMDGKSMDYLTGILDSITADRAEALRSLNDANFKMNDEAQKLSGPLTGIALRKLDRTSRKEA